MTEPVAEVISASELTPAHEAAWAAIMRERPEFRSPFYSVGFLKAVASHRPDLHVAVFRGDGRMTGFLPFHRRRLGRAAALAAPIADYQGLVGDGQAGLDPAALLRGCGIRCFDYDHARGDDPLFSAHAFRRTTSPLIDLSEGFEAWRTDRRAAGSALKTAERKMRKLERECGPLRFIADDRSDAAWATFLNWKRAALAGQGVRFILDEGWARAVVEDIRMTQTPDFAGLFSTLYAGERLVSAHFGMRSGSSWHWWFPSYDPQMSAHTPGLALLVLCARHAAETGLVEIDLGRGDERYKREFASGAHPLCEGSLERSTDLPGLVRRLRKGLYRRVESRVTPQVLDVKRRVFNRVLGAGRI